MTELDAPGVGRPTSGVVLQGVDEPSVFVAMVREIEGFTRADYIEAVRSSLEQQGWCPSTAEAEADELINMVEQWPEGAVAERRLDHVVVRSLTTSPG